MPAFVLKKIPVLSAAIIAASLITACGKGSGSSRPGASGLSSRLVTSQSVFTPAASPGLVIINGENDTVPRAAEISAGTSPGLMAISPDRATLLSFDSSSNSVDVINTARESQTGSIPLSAPTISMAVTSATNGYAAVSAAPLIGLPTGGIVAMNLGSPSVYATISVPNAQMVVASPNGNQLLVFSDDDLAGTVTVVFPQLINSGTSPSCAPVTIPPTVVCTISGFDQPAYAVFSADGSTAYVLNCGPECGGNTASIQVVDMSTLALVGPPIPVDGATIGWLSETTLYVAGTPTASATNSTPDNSCAGETTAATICGRVDVINVATTPPTVTSSAVITNGYHNRITMSVNGQVFVGSYDCTNIGDVNNPIGEVRGCLSIYNSTSGAVVIPPDNGDVTGLQALTSRYVVYVAEGGNLRVYDALTDSLLLDQYISTGTIEISGQLIDVKAIDFF